MNRILRALSRLFLIGCLGTLLPLRAQLNPQLITATPDFLDLYQASATAVSLNKPEICTVFDFSGSMQSLMFHPQYQNGDLTDGDAYGSLKFTLNAAGNDVYTITATANNDSNVSTTIVATVAANGATVGTSSGATLTETLPNGTHNYTANTTLSAITTSTATPAASGTNMTFVCTESGSNTGTHAKAFSAGVTWSISSGSITSGGVWTVPAYSSPSVTCTYSGGNKWGGGSFSSMTSSILVGPDGNPITAAMIPATSTYDGGNLGATDVRNWVRCASHVRFSMSDTTTSPAVTRTIDIPIPWIITDGTISPTSTTGAPLASLKVNDPVSGNNMEIDSIYSLHNGDFTFCTSVSPPYVSGSSYTSTTKVTTVYLTNVWWRPTYIQWLFQGKYTTAGTAYHTGGPNSGPYYVVFDAANASLAGGQAGHLSWGQGYGGAAPFGTTITVPSFDGNNNYLGDVTEDASANIVPARTRCEAVKEAAIRTWIAYQGSVIWAYRFLDPSNEINYPSDGYKINNDSTAYATATLPMNNTGNTPINGVYSAWQVMNGNSVAAMQNLSAYVPYNGTPLTGALARAYAQFSDPSSVFNALEEGLAGGLPLPKQCQNHVFMLFTDGLDNNGTDNFPLGGSSNPAATPYIFSNTTPPSPTPAPNPLPTTVVTEFDAAIGNLTVITTPTSIQSTYWNLYTMAGCAAHLADTTLPTGDYEGIPSGGYPTHTSSAITSYLPFAIPSRGSTADSNLTPFNPPARIQTYTVGVSLGGTFSQSGSPKQSLFYAAVVGDPSVSHYNDISILQPFSLKVPGDPTSGPANNCVYYFDGTNPTALVNSLNYAIASTLKNGTNSASNPNLPFVGASLGQELYVGEFTPPTSTSPLWPGDLLMFSTQLVNGAPVIVTSNNTAVTALTAANAEWSAAASMPLWSKRKLYTRIPQTTGTTDPGLVTFTDLSPGLAVISPYIDNGNGEPLTSDTVAQAIQNAAGANIDGTTDSTGRPNTNRATIMGDIIDSSPSALEYNLSQATGNSAFANYPHISSFANPQHFRLIIVGDNQGWVHGFGEVSATNSIGNDANGNPINITTGQVDELWAFMPTEFLPYLDYLETENPHEFMADGSPTIYFLDQPSTGYPNGNGVYDSGNNERAIAIFGLRKGGRSYYALNISNPFAPTLQWTLRPDEASLLTNKTLVDGSAAISPSMNASVNVKGIVANMGWSTCVPALGRVQYNGYLKDVVFLGGGYSVKQLDHNFPTYPAPAGQSTPLGRSVIALDAYTGQILAAADMTKVKSTIGPICTSLIPFEFFLNSGMAQRAYFMDYLGGLWCWDQNVESTTAPYTGYRMDSSDLGTWSGDQSVKIRQIYQDATSTTPLYTALAAPFLVGSFPGLPYSTSLASPAAVGILMASGDRNNPIDESAGYGDENNGPTTVPTTSQPFRLTCVFDRQDSANWSSNLTQVGTSYVIEDVNLKNFSGAGTGLPSLTAGAAAITPSSANPSSYYLAPTNADGSAATGSTYFGYYIDFPNGVSNAASNSGIFIPKALTDPIVVGGSAFYSYFTPTTAQTCGGGNGNTTSDIICDVINPSLSVATASCQTGSALPAGMTTWTGVPSNFSNFGTTGVLQGGAVSTTTGGVTTTQVQLEMMKNAASNQYPKVRVWRVVH